MLLIPEEFLLLCLDDEKGTLATMGHAGVAMGGGVLAELNLARAVRLTAAEGWGRPPRVQVSGAVRLDDPLLAAGLATVAEKPRSATSLVQRLGKGVKESLLERLVLRGDLTREQDNVLGVFPRSVWPAANGRDERAIRERLDAVLVHRRTPDERSAALIGLLWACGIVHKVVQQDVVPAREVKARAGEIASHDWVAKALRDAIAAAQAATI